MKLLLPHVLLTIFPIQSTAAVHADPYHRFDAMDNVLPSFIHEQHGLENMESFFFQVICPNKLLPAFVAAGGNNPHEGFRRRDIDLDNDHDLWIRFEEQATHHALPRVEELTKIGEEKPDFRLGVETAVILQAACHGY